MDVEVDLLRDLEIGDVLLVLEKLDDRQAIFADGFRYDVIHELLCQFLRCHVR